MANKGSLHYCSDLFEFTFTGWWQNDQSRFRNMSMVSLHVYSMPMQGSGINPGSNQKKSNCSWAWTKNSLLLHPVPFRLSYHQYSKYQAVTKKTHPGPSMLTKKILRSAKWELLGSSDEWFAQPNNRCLNIYCRYANVLTEMASWHYGPALWLSLW